MSDKPKIIVVDDESIIAMSVELKLKSMGYDVLDVAWSGEEGVRMASDLRPDLVLMDIRLGGNMDGIEAARRIRAETGIPIVFLTAFSDEETLHRAKVTEPFGYVLKPVVDRELRIVVEMALYRGKAERALMLSEEKFRTVLETANDAVVSSGSGGNIVFFNKAAEQLFGFSSSEAAGLPLTELIPARHQEKINRHLESLPAADRGGAEGRTVEAHGRRKGGSEFPAEWSLSTWQTVDGLFFTALVRDLTERLRAQEAHRRNLEYEELNRAKDEFLAVVSHELRTPLTSMLGWTSLLRKGRVSASEQAHALEVVERNIVALQKLVEDLLEVSRIVSGKVSLMLRPVDLGAAADAALETMQPVAAAKNIRLAREFVPERLVVQGDCGRLQQIFVNLLSNAVKFTPMGGRVEMRIARDATHAVVTVSDNGIGIERDFVPRVFDRFSQEDLSATRLYKGLGLGLAIARHLVELHGGTVSAESAGKLQGARFTLRLPISTVLPAADSQDSPVASALNKPLHDLKVLVVEDESDINDFLSSALTIYGASVESAGNADEALLKLDTFKADVMVCDIGLPGDDGYALIRKVRKRVAESGGNIPAIAVTGYTTAKDIIEALSAGFQTHVNKPLDPVELAQTIVSLTGRSRP